MLDDLSFWKNYWSQWKLNEEDIHVKYGINGILQQVADKLYVLTKVCEARVNVILDQLLSEKNKRLRD